MSDAAQDNIKKEVEEEVAADNDETFEDDFEDESGLGLSLNIDSVVGGVSEDHETEGQDLGGPDGHVQEQNYLNDQDGDQCGPPNLEAHDVQGENIGNQEDAPPDLDQDVRNDTQDQDQDAPVDLSSHDSVDVSGETVEAESMNVKDEVEEREEESLPRIWYARKSTTPR